MKRYSVLFKRIINVRTEPFMAESVEEALARAEDDIAFHAILHAPGQNPTVEYVEDGEEFDFALVDELDAEGEIVNNDGAGEWVDLRVGPSAEGKHHHEMEGALVEAERVLAAMLREFKTTTTEEIWHSRLDALKTIQATLERVKGG